ncbi:unnamed protein product [Linum trigynum]|uniref:Uncharacterized protein n=1 Tax=Linum trigynum TaxID=586398 RepID=A0AAV2E5S2_9ROSI
MEDLGSSLEGLKIPSTPCCRQSLSPSPAPLSNPSSAPTLQLSHQSFFLAFPTLTGKLYSYNASTAFRSESEPATAFSNSVTKKFSVMVVMSLLSGSWAGAVRG